MQSDDMDKLEEPQSNCSHWHREHESWESDVSRWQADHQHALVELEHIAQLVVSHGQALRRHATDLEAHKQGLTAIQRSGQAAAVSASTVDGLSGGHRKYRDIHQRIRRHHEIVVASLQALADAARAPF